MCPHSTICVSSYYYICVWLFWSVARLFSMCSNTTVCMCPHATMDMCGCFVSVVTHIGHMLHSLRTHIYSTHIACFEDICVRDTLHDMSIYI